MELSQGTLVAILAAVLIADILVVAFALLYARYRKGKDAQALASSGPRPILAGSGAPAPATTAFGAAGAATAAAASRAFPDMPSIDPTNDPLTNLLTPGTWSRLVLDEEARIRRYHRPATVVMIELEGLDRLVARLGPGAVDRIVPAVADTLRRGAREADQVARLGTSRFGVLMPETDEVLAINYVERVRRACDLWLESGAVSLRLAIGWASSSGDGSLVDAEALATDRMYLELRRAVRANTPDGPAPTNGGMEPAFES